MADYHADAEAVGGLASRAGVGVLVLTHLTPYDHHTSAFVLGIVMEFNAYWIGRV